MTDDLTERIRQVMQEYGYTPSVFADEIGVQRPAISHILSGRNRASLDVVIKILKAFAQIDSHWLLTGEGQMKQLNLFGEGEEEVVVVENKKEVQNTVPIVSHKEDINKSDDYDKEVYSTSSEEPARTVRETVKPPEIIQEPVSAPEPVAATAPPPLVEEVKTSFAQESLKADSQEKVIEKMIVFYTDKTFSVYKPE